MILENNEIKELPDDTISIIKNLIKYQNEKLIRHIAKEKGWNEQELLQEFLFKQSNSNNYINLINTQLSTNTEKKKSLNLNMDKINDSDTDSNNVASPVLSQSSSCQSLDSLNNNSTLKKKRVLQMLNLKLKRKREEDQKKIKV